MLREVLRIPLEQRSAKLPEKACNGVGDTHVFPGKQPTADHTVHNDFNAKLAAGLEEPDLLVLDVGREGRVLDLDGRDRVHSLRAAKRVRADLGKAEVLDLSGPMLRERIVSEPGPGYPACDGGTYFTCSAIALTVSSIETAASSLKLLSPRFWG